MALAPDVLTAVLSSGRVQPSSPAAKDDTRDLDYAALIRDCESLAAGLVERGVQPGDRVALQLPNSVDFLAAALTCLWVGAIFVPLAAVDPSARVAGIVADCSPALILTNQAISQPHPAAVDISIVRTLDARAPDPVDPLDQPAYAIYTSGTTGTPKGVVIGRRAFAAAVRSTINALGLDRSTRSLCVSPFHFDGSFGTLFTTIAAGGSLVIPPRDSLLFVRNFFRAVRRERVTCTSFSPSYLRLLLNSPQLPSLADTALEVLALGGEACSRNDVALLRAAAPDVRVFNRYGPTETTITVTNYEIPQNVVDDGGSIPIGVPHEGVRFYLVDDHDEIIEVSGKVGELYIGGVQLMAGYWRAPALSAQVMRTDLVPGEKLYRTGDLVLRSPDGNYVYVDRADRVVKRNAVRISLIELGDVLRGLPGVSGATCVTFDNGGELGIAAFVVTNGAGNTVELRRAAAERLPASMLPDRIDRVAALPLTPSSKVDERKLLADAGLRAV